MSDVFREAMADHLEVLGGEADPQVVEAAFLGGAATVLASLVNPTPEDASALAQRIGEISKLVSALVADAKVRALADIAEAGFDA